MAMNIIYQPRATACDGITPAITEAGQTASPQQSTRMVLRSTSERKPVLLRPLGTPASSRSNAAPPGSPGHSVVEQAGNDVPSRSRPSPPLSSTIVRRINHLACDDHGKNSRSLLRLHGSDAVRTGDPLAPLNIQWLISTDDPVAPGELGKAMPPPRVVQAVADSPPAFLPSAAEQQSPIAVSAEAFFHYPGPVDDGQQFAQWLKAHPIHQMFLQVYPVSEAFNLLGLSMHTPMHTVLEGGIIDPTRFHRSLMQICAQAESGSIKPATLRRDAMAVSKHADGLLQKKADFFSRLFAALVALEAGVDQDENARISETLRQEWLETDFSMLLGRPEASLPQAQRHAAEPVRTQVSGRRTFANAMEDAGMSPRKKQKVVHHHETATPAADEGQALARQTPASPRHSSPQASDHHTDADLSPPLEGHGSPNKLRARSWKAYALKRKAKLREREFKAWRENIAGRSVTLSPVRTQQSPVQQADQPPMSSAAGTSTQAHEKPLS